MASRWEDMMSERQKGRKMQRQVDSEAARDENSLKID